MFNFLLLKEEKSALSRTTRDVQTITREISGRNTDLNSSSRKKSLLFITFRTAEQATEAHSMILFKIRSRRTHHTNKYVLYLHMELYIH